MGDLGPELSVHAPDGPVQAVVIVLPGGRQFGDARVHRWSLVVLRMLPFVRSIRRRVPGCATVLVCYRHRGWNHADPVEDVGAALRVAQQRFGSVPVVLVGHSMGGRAAVHAAALPGVRAVVGLAPWVRTLDPVESLTGRRVVLLHGSRDHTTRPDDTADYAVRAARFAIEVVSLRLVGTGHPMLRRGALWHRLTADAVSTALSGAPLAQIGADERGVCATADRGDERHRPDSWSNRIRVRRS